MRYCMCRFCTDNSASDTILWSCRTDADTQFSAKRIEVFIVLFMSLVVFFFFLSLFLFFFLSLRPVIKKKWEREREREREKWRASLRNIKLINARIDTPFKKNNNKTDTQNTHTDTSRQTDRQAGKQAGRQAGRQTDRQTRAISLQDWAAVAGLF